MLRIRHFELNLTTESSRQGSHGRRPTAVKFEVAPAAIQNGSRKKLFSH